MRVAILAAIVLVPVPAAAQPSSHPAVSLSYALGPGVTHCPDASALRGSIAARLGRDPFVAASPDPQSRLSITVLRVGRGLRALITWDHGESGPLSSKDAKQVEPRPQTVST